MQSRIWLEEPEHDNPFAARASYCHGYDVYGEMLGRAGAYRPIAEPNRNTALVGAIVMEDLDFIVDPGAQRIYPRDPERIIAEVGDVEML